MRRESQNNYLILSRILSLNLSRLKLLACMMQSSFICRLFSCVSSCTAFINSSIVAFGEIRIQVLQFITVSFNHQSLTPITGTQQAIDSMGLIQKSSSIGIYIVAIASLINFLSSSSLGDLIAVILG